MEKITKTPNNDEILVKRDYKSRIFKMLYENKEDLLDLYSKMIQGKNNININPGKNDKLLNACKSLRDYVEYTSRVRLYAEMMEIEDAVERAITECIAESILAEFLTRCRSEAKKMSIYEYDEERQRRFDREEGRERFVNLTEILINENRIDELKRATKDVEFCELLYKQLGVV